MKGDTAPKAPVPSLGRLRLFTLIFWLLLFQGFGGPHVALAANEECGELAGGLTCPLNVCCSRWGFCGTTPDFCDASQGCVSNCGGDFKPSTPWGYDVRNTIIAYWQTWTSSLKGCAKKTPASNMPLGSVSHINTAFAYIKPKTFTIYPIDGISIEHFKAVTNLKTKSPGTKVWLSIGGWTFSDNDTVTQPVWSDLSSTKENRKKFILGLEQFMSEWGFDGVDLDWEYPTAEDRRGKKEDTLNYVYLCQDIKAHFTQIGRRWGLSFTAPASYWYMKHFDIKGMAEAVDFVNLMTYDMHGSWDSRSRFIGAKIYSHTNMTEIKDALQLLWRNKVTADKVNLGLGFYGRTYTLKDPNCATPGCEFSVPGRPGPCTDTEGYLSYAEIKNIIKQTGGTPVYDRETMTKYMRYDKDQWVSFDDPETIKAKVKFANEVGFRGLFIWAIDQDTDDHELLAATLGDKKLGYFGSAGDGSDWTSYRSSECKFSQCGAKCGAGEQRVDSVLCYDGGQEARRSLCCPLDGSPDSDFCEWRTGSIGLCLGASANPCHVDEVLIIKSKYYYDKIPGGGIKDRACPILGYEASYCCKSEQMGEALCGWTGTCETIEGGRPPQGKTVCEKGQQFVTSRTGNCGRGKAEPYCCSAGVDLGKLSCHWNLGKSSIGDCGSYDECGANEADLGRHEGGGGIMPCIVPPPKTFGQGPRRGGGSVGTKYVQPRLCCNRDALKINVKTLPVPVENLFFEEDLKKLPKGSKTEYSLFVDSTMGGQQGGTGNTDPNKNSFAWHIIDGPADEVTSIDKRDGSHWELWNCDDEHHEGRQTAHMVCTDDSADTNCGRIWSGQVAGTVIKMPQGCGPGKYAMAVSLEPDLDELPLPYINIRSSGRRRGLEKPAVYKLTFDYDFSPLQKRAATNTLIRIDYSDNPGYWSHIVAARPGNRKTRRELLREIDDVHDGRWHSWLDHHFNLERRDTPDHELHVLHARWFSVELDKWITRMRDIEKDYTAIRHRVSDVYRVTLFDETKICQISPGVQQTLHASLKATMNINVETSAQLTIIGTLGNLKSFKQSHVTLRNKGSVDVVIDFQAHAELRFGSLSNELAGFAPLGASVVIPGIVTIGPQFKILAGLDGVMEVHANSQFRVQLAKWDFAQSYPFKGDRPWDKDDLDIQDNGQDGASRDTSNRTLGPDWTWDVGASGSVKVHLTPQITFGIIWNEKLGVPNAAINFGVDTWGRVYGHASVGAASEASFCYGIDAGYEVYVSTFAPTLFPGLPNLNQRWTITDKEVPVLKSSDNCGTGGPRRRRGMMGFDQTPAVSWAAQSLAELPGASLQRETDISGDFVDLKPEKGL